MTDTIDLAGQLIREKSVTPDKSNCQSLISTFLKEFGFQTKTLSFGDVDNIWSVSPGDGPLLVFAGHTDVVPTGPYEQWTHPPFDAVVNEGYLYGRGAADMKSSIAAMMVATRRVMQRHTLKGRLGFLITGDEEGPATDGTVKVIDYLNDHGVKIDWCIVGEPTSTAQLGDVIKNGRRGSLNGKLTVHGRQGHVAYPHLAQNPVHLFAEALAELTAEAWDNGNEFFPPTTFQISNLNAGTGVENVIPGELSCQFNFRFSTEVTDEQLKSRVVEILQARNLDYELSWRLSGNPFITNRGRLVDATSKAIETVCGITTELSTSGGTSDGRFIAPTGAEVLELGPINATIHQIDECVSCDDLLLLTDIYEKIIVDLLV
jgi:succinyl-diaminopimelate desuccinylase